MIFDTLILPKSGINNDSYPYIKVQISNDLRLKFECLDGNLSLHMRKPYFEEFIYSEDDYKKECWVDLNSFIKATCWVDLNSLNSFIKATGTEPELGKILIKRTEDNNGICEKLNLMKVILEGEECFNNTYFIDFVDEENYLLMRIYIDNVNDPKKEEYKVRVTLE